MCSFRWRRPTILVSYSLTVFSDPVVPNAASSCVYLWSRNVNCFLLWPLKDNTARLTSVVECNKALCLWVCDPWRREHYKTIVTLQITGPKHGRWSPAIHNHRRNGALQSVQTQCGTNTWSSSLHLISNSSNTVSSSGEKKPRMWNLFKFSTFSGRESWTSHPTACWHYSHVHNLHSFLITLTNFNWLQIIFITLYSFTSLV